MGNNVKMANITNIISTILLRLTFRTAKHMSSLRTITNYEYKMKKNLYSLLSSILEFSMS